MLNLEQKKEKLKNLEKRFKLLLLVEGIFGLLLIILIGIVWFLPISVKEMITANIVIVLIYVISILILFTAVKSGIIK